MTIVLDPMKTFPENVLKQFNITQSDADANACISHLGLHTLATLLKEHTDAR